MSSTPSQLIPYYIASTHAEALGGVDHDNTTTLGYSPLSSKTEPDTNATAIMNADLLNNPYVIVQAYNPETDVLSMWSTVLQFQSDALAISPLADWTAHVAAAKTVYDTHFGSISGELDDLADAEHKSLALQAAAEYGVLAAGAVDIGAVHSSAFIRAKARIVDRVLAETAKSTARMRLADKQFEVQSVMQSVGDIIKLAVTQMDMEKTAVALALDQGKAAITAMSNYYEMEGENLVSFQKWDMERMQDLGGFIGAAQGAPRITSEGKGARLGSFLSGAALGATPGTALGNPLIAIAGAGIGGILGMIFG